MPHPDEAAPTPNSGPQRHHFSGAVVVILIVNFTCLLLFAWLLNQRYTQHQQDINDLHELEDNVFTIDKSFRLQIQEWKNILLRGHEVGAFNTYLAAFRHQEQTFQSHVDELLQSSMPQVLHDAFTKVKQHHQEISAVYNQSLALLGEKNKNVAVADRNARGVDRSLQNDLNNTYKQLQHYIKQKDQDSWNTLHRYGLIFIASMLLINLISLSLTSFFTRRVYTSLDREGLRLKNVMHASPVGVFLFFK